MYILLKEDKTVKEIIPDINPVFPGVPVEERYAPDFVAGLIHVPDGTEVDQNWSYDEDTHVFAPPAPQEISGDSDAEPIQPEENYYTANDMIKAMTGGVTR